MTRSMDLTQYTGMVGVIAGLYALILGIYGLLAGAELKRDRSMRLLAGGLGLLLTGVYRLGDVIPARQMIDSFGIPLCCD